MKIHIDLPWGGVFTFERQPMEPYKFYVMWVCIAVIRFLTTLIKTF